MTADGFDPTVDVQAPLNCVAWTASRGWLESPEDVTAAVDAGDTPFMADDTGVVRDVVGDARLALILLVDKRITSVRRTAEEADREIARRAAEIGARLSEYGDRMDEIGVDVDDVRVKVLSAAERLAQALSEPPGGGGS